MNCPSCNARSSDAVSTCGECGIDIALYKKAENMSEVHYNNALKMANDSDLSGAIENLKTGLDINKKNIRVRNLLGLCYYATGKIGEAMREWNISIKIQDEIAVGATEPNPAKEYLENLKKNHAILDNFANSVSLYNEALRYMEQGSDDLAIIRLRRSLEINPNFVDALNLLALAYLKNDNKTKAAVALEKALDVDKGNIIAKQYHQKIFGKRPGRNSTPIPAMKKDKEEIAKAQKSKQVPSYSPFGNNGKKRRDMGASFTLPGIASFAVGLAAMFLFMQVLFIPSAVADWENEVGILRESITSQQLAHVSALNQKDDVILGLEQERNNLRGLLDSVSQTNDALQSERQVLFAGTLLQQNQHEMAMQTLGDIDFEELSTDMQNLYEGIRAAAIPVLERSSFEEGERLFNGQNFLEARFALERAMNYNHDQSTIRGNIYYLLGRIAENDGENELARRYYENIIDNNLRGEGANRVTAANTRLRRLPS